MSKSKGRGDEERVPEKPKKKLRYPKKGTCYLVFGLSPKGLVTLCAVDTTQAMANLHLEGIKHSETLQAKYIRQWVERRDTNHLFMYEAQMAARGLLPELFGSRKW